MAVIVETVGPQVFLTGICKSIDGGKVQTWKYQNRNSEIYFTHCANQWDGKAWLKPVREDGVLVFYIYKANNVVLTTEIYAVFHGRFIEMLLAHFYQQMSKIWATAKPANGDQIK